MKDLLLNSNVVAVRDDNGDEQKGRLVVDEDGVVRFVPEDDDA